MDGPRRWQVGSSVTALAGLGLGAILLSRPSIEPVEPIRLLVADAATDGTTSGAGRTSLPDVVVELPDGEGLTIVPPVVVEDPPGSAAEASVVTVASVASVDRGDSDDSDDSDD